MADCRLLIDDFRVGQATASGEVQRQEFRVRASIGNGQSSIENEVRE